VRSFTNRSSRTSTLVNFTRCLNIPAKGSLYCKEYFMKVPILLAMGVIAIV